MHPAKWLFAHEALERLDSERELTGGERALGSEAAPSETLEVLRLSVLRPVDDAEVVAPADLERGLGNAAAAADDEAHRLHDHAFAPGVGQRPPARIVRRGTLRVTGPSRISSTR
jgi:hypothetical protein